METITIQIGAIESIVWITVTVLGLGFAWGTLKNDVKNIKESIGEFKKSIREHDQDIATIKGRLIADSHSPRQLNEFGRKVLAGSGIKEIIENKKDALAEKVRKKNPTNPYDAERAIEQAVSEIPESEPELLDAIKTGAFNTGVDVDLVLLAGSLHLRNLIFKDLGFELEELDTHQADVH
ncbi:hypothetical protein BK004_03220 [bacterium CG10_46_32]|nr:MAG: hypothetical protein BK004_03220 [bacterium CG10_46_32]PIR56007.1 MAG: hypothetical protein COU73_03255 [Parcubacteria group bacterium CG10_big_fil_rev_8_21_14_0_10_46_32]